MAFQFIIDIGHQKPIYEQIVEQVEQAVSAADLAPGSPLPTVRQLAEDLEVNVNTVMKAYKILEQRHLVVSAGRKGTFINARATDFAAKNLDDEIRLKLFDLIDHFLQKGASATQIKKSFNQILENKK